MVLASLKQKSTPESILAFIASLYPNRKTIPLHEPVLGAAEKTEVTACIDSSFVSSVGVTITAFEKLLCEFTGAKFAVATVNGTAALHLALVTAGVKPGMEVITQAATFIATANAIRYCNAEPIFIDVNRNSLGLCPQALRAWLTKNTEIKNQRCYNRNTGNEIKACIAMHTFGHPCDIYELQSICEEFCLTFLEDAAEALGSDYHRKQVGTFGLAGVLSFNGNKIITTGGGGALLTNDPNVAASARHLATTAKQDPLASTHDEIGFNYRLPALNAALGCAQMKRLPLLLQAKQNLAEQYAAFFNALSAEGYQWIKQPEECRANFWLNTVLCPTQQDRDLLLQLGAEQGIHCRPLWQPIPFNQPYQHCQRGPLAVTEYIAARLINLPSSVRGSCYDVLS